MQKHDVLFYHLQHLKCALQHTVPPGKCNTRPALVLASPEIASNGKTCKKERDNQLACSVHVVVEDKTAGRCRVQGFTLQLSLVTWSVAAALDEHVVT